MNNISFENAPVIELLAELRWLPPTVVMSEGNAPVPMIVGREVEEFFMMFSNEIAKSGFNQAERVVPPGFPLLLHQVMWRFKSPKQPGVLLQVGPGLFSANALQPYKRWKDFKPTVELGIAALLATRPIAEKDLTFSAVTLRYMNAFTGELLGANTPTGFIRDVLGFKVALPTIFTDLTGGKGQSSETANVLLPVANTTKVMSVAVGDGMVNSAPAAIYDISVSETRPVAGDLKAVLDGLTASRDLIHQCFLVLTESIRDKMKPER